MDTTVIILIASLLADIFFKWKSARATKDASVVTNAAITELKEMQAVTTKRIDTLENRVAFVEAEGKGVSPWFGRSSH